MAIVAGVSLDVVAELEDGAHLGAGEIGNGATVFAGETGGGGENIGVLLYGDLGFWTIESCLTSH